MKSASFKNHTWELSLVDSLSRANRCASTAVRALIWVDMIDIALRNSLARTLAGTSTASHAIFRNYVSHFE